MQVSTSGIKNKTIHFGGLTRATYYQVGKKFAERFGYDTKLVQKKHIAGQSTDQKPEWDYSLNSTYAVENLKVKPLLLEETFDLLDKHLIP